MKKIRPILDLTVLLTLVLVQAPPLRAQQDAMYSMYMFNGLALNPAYAGARDRATIVALYRHQWTGLDGAPQTLSLSGHSPLLNDKIGLGLSLTNDRISIFNRLAITGHYAFRINIRNKGKLALGLSVTFHQIIARWGDITLNEMNDQAFQQSRESLITPNFGAGIYYYMDKFYAGFSVPNFLNMSLKENVRFEGTADIARFWKHYFFTAGMMFRITDKVKFKPSVLFKYVRNAPFEADLNASFLFMDAFWLGASYRTGDAVLFMVEYNFSKGIRIGYAYDYTLTELTDYNSGTHEIMVGYEFVKKDTYLTPRRMSYF
ncbi:MAG: membrane protein [Chitinophagales bacterium]|nr:MAG: membrane protein [Chitinophagales bacterium]